jgi:hypothetical protein
MTFGEGYGANLDRELGTADRTQRFTSALRKAYFNEGVAKFNERTGCYVKRASIALVDGTAEYDLEAVATFAGEDYLRPSKTSASLRKYDGAGSANTDYSYLEGDSQLFYVAEEELNQQSPNWRAVAASTPQKWFLREDGASVWFTLHPGPDVPVGETWTVYWPYVAKAPALVADADIPYLGRISLVPYHEGPLYYAAAQCELLRKNREGHEWQMKRFAAAVAQYRGDMAPPRGSSVRVAQRYFGMQRAVAHDPTRWP